jgi:hypothetical protein
MGLFVALATRFSSLRQHQTSVSLLAVALELALPGGARAVAGARGSRSPLRVASCGVASS